MHSFPIRQLHFVLTFTFKVQQANTAHVGLSPASPLAAAVPVRVCCRHDIFLHAFRSFLLRCTTYHSTPLAAYRDPDITPYLRLIA